MIEQERVSTQCSTVRAEEEEVLGSEGESPRFSLPVGYLKMGNFYHPSTWRPGAS
jgi:hypothetical protein